MSIDLESFVPSGSAVLLREASSARHRFTALSCGLFTILRAAVRIDVDGAEYVSRVAGENLLRGFYYPRMVYAVDGGQVPQPQVADLIALTINRETSAAFEVLAAGTLAPSAQLVQSALASDELILQFRPELGSLLQERVNIQQASALPLPQERAT